MSTPKYWRGLEELEQTPEFLAQAEQEFPTDKPIDEVLAEASEEALSLESNRRDFLKVLGFGVTAATLTACAEGPVKKAIPYVSRPEDIPEDIIPGVANWYASTTNTGTPVVVKTREGRPIKLEGNPDAASTKGGLSALDQATILDLYDTDRLRRPRTGGNYSSWEQVDGDITKKLEEIKANGGTVRILSNTVLSPSANQLVGEFLGGFADAKHVTYDALSTSAMAKAHEMAFGKRAIPSIAFDKAMTIVSFNCDFLGSWLNPVGFAADYIVNRNPDKPMSRHIQFESLVTNTGSKADMRFPLNPSQEAGALVVLYNMIASKVGKGQIPGAPQFNLAGNSLDMAAKELYDNKGKSLLVCGTNDVSAQLIVAAINQMLGNYGTTLDLNNTIHLQKGDDEAFASLVEEMNQGSVDALFVYGANPVYNSPMGAAFAEGLKKVDLSVSFAWKEDETSVLCTYTTPDNYYLESWGDAQQTDAQLTLIQPTIHPIFETRQAADSFLKWSGNDQTYADYLKAYWETNLFPMQTEYSSFRQFWNETLRKGVFMKDASQGGTVSEINPEMISTAGNSLKGKFKTVTEGEFDVFFYPKVGIGSGDQANNPWLQELPDPIQRVAWDNYVTVPLAVADEKGLKNEDVIEVNMGEKSVFMPVIVQPGQAKNTLGIAVGYGRSKEAGIVAKKANGEILNGKPVAGTNVYPFTSMDEGAVKYFTSGAVMANTGMTYPLALTQTFNTLFDPAKGASFFKLDFDRTAKIVEETSTAEIADGTYKKVVSEREAIKQHLVTLWDAHLEDPETARNIHWKMAIDLNKCTGCGACVVACNAENNVPVVGKEEVRLRREMHWMRIDRYYTGSPDNPDVVFQPMLCQHCDNAPCETVCPVLATIHSNEGLNQMTYNRCIGTRYCANNCPYKVRRFNWFNYWNDDQLFGDFYTHKKLGRLVLNPDVTVRFRGVMEKCSFCVQRLQEGKLRAKVNAQSTFAKPEDGEIQTACQQSCPTGAIVFGDANDRNSEIYKALRKERSYVALEEVKTLPSVQYQALVRNRTKDEVSKKQNEFNEWKSNRYGIPVESNGHGGEEKHEGDHA